MPEIERTMIRVRKTLAGVLPKGLRADVRARGGLAPAFDVTISAGAVDHSFVAGWAGEGWPNDVQRLVALVPDVAVVAAVAVSDGARAWLSQQDLGWVDESGRSDISLPSGLVVLREPSQLRVPRERPVRWTRSMLAATEAALSGSVPTVEAVERATGLSRNATTIALERLERLGYLERPTARRGPMSGRRIVDAGVLLDAYAAAATELAAKQPRVLVHRLWSDPLHALRDEIGPALNATDGQWAVTGVAASMLLAPYLTDVTTLELYVDAELIADRSHLASLLNGRVVEKGHRVEIRTLPTTISAAGPVIDGVHVAVPVRVYADLVANGGRSAEAAHHLRETLNVGATA